MRKPPAKEPAAAAPPGAAWHRLIIPGLFALTVVAYSNSFGAGFPLDNLALIVQDARLRAATSENLGLILGHTYWWPVSESGLYRPLTTLSYLFNYAILGNGEHAGGYHAINFLLHALNVVLAYLLARKLLGGEYRAAAVAALWAVHPALTESVTNVVGRADLLAGGAILGGFWCYLKSAESTGWRRGAWLAGLAALTTAGVFSKESAVAILGVIVIYEWLWRPRGEGRIPRGMLPAWAAVLGPVLAMWLVRAKLLAIARPVIPFTDNPIAGAPFWQAKLTALAVLGRYFWLMLWPLRLSSDYSYSQIALASGSLVDWAAWATLAAAVTAAVVWRRNRGVTFFLWFALVNLVPVSNLLVPIGTIMADRLVYLPSLGLCAAIVAAWPDGRRARTGLAVVVALLVVVWGARTYARNFDWKDDLSLASADVKTAPSSYKTHFRLAAALYAGDSGHANLDRVIQEAERSLAIVDGLPDRLNTALVYWAAGEFYLAQADRFQPPGADGAPVTTAAGRQLSESSVRVLERSLSILAAEQQAGLAPGVDQEPEIRRLLSAGYLNLGQFQQALSAAREALRLDPLDPRVYWQVVRVLMGEGRGPEAATVLMEGGVATGDPAMRQELVRLYQAGLDPKGCALLPGSGALNPQCETVRNQVCAASADLERLARESPRPGISGQLSQIPNTGCPPPGR